MKGEEEEEGLGKTNTFGLDFGIESDTQTSTPKFSQACISSAAEREERSDLGNFLFPPFFVG